MSFRAHAFHLRFVAAFLATGVALLACSKQHGPGLPPLEGPGAAAAPTITAPEPEAADPQAAAPDRASTGTLRAREVAALGPKEPGVIASLSVNEGDRVRKGQVLFRLDSAQVALAVEQANAALNSAKVQAASAQTLFDRVKALRERGAATPDVYDQAKAQVDNARSMVVQAQTAVDSAAHRLSNMVVSSPLDGVVTEKRMNVGENATLMPPSIVLVIQNIDQLELHARLPEMALSSVHEGGTIKARFPALRTSKDVRVKRIAPTVDPRTRTIEVVADLDNRDHRLLAGMLVEVSYEEAAPDEHAELRQ
jgi:RND family efflux transporter MFP subunit